MVQELDQQRMIHIRADKILLEDQDEEFYELKHVILVNSKIRIYHVTLCNRLVFW